MTKSQRTISNKNRSKGPPYPEYIPGGASTREEGRE